MKLETIVNAYPALCKLAGQDLPLPTLYRFSKLIAVLEPEINFFIQQREKLFAAYGKTEQDGYTILPEHMEVFGDKMRELTEMELEIDGGANALPLVLPLVHNVNLSFNDLQLLKDFITLEGGENA